MPAAQNYRTQDLRRGHARDLQSSGITLEEFRAAGQWAPGLSRYADMQAVEDEAVAEARVFKQYQAIRVPECLRASASQTFDNMVTDSESVIRVSPVLVSAFPWWPGPSTS